ncbi:MAG: DUF4349 domain-containing protein [Leptolinea sp.]|nr:DUF4349 domain-containing protein [Leptolinea sp.]
MKRIALSLTVLVLLYTGCAPAASEAPAMNMPLEQKSYVSNEMAPPSPMADEMAGDWSDNQSYGGEIASQVDQLVIQNANLSIVVVDPLEALNSVTMMAEEMNGYIVESNVYKTSNENGLETPEARLTIRVPAEKLTEAMDRIKALTQDPDVDVISENRSGQNVTKEYTDLKSRLKNLEEAESQLREIMASATRTEDVMSVFNQLTQVREQIEVIKGQMKYYEESAAMSAIQIYIRSKASIAPLSIGGWQPAGVARNAIQSLINALKFFANAGIWIVLFFVPVLIILLIPVWLVFLVIRSIVRRNKAKKAAALTTDSEATKKE